MCTVITRSFLKNTIVFFVQCILYNQCSDPSPCGDCCLLTPYIEAGQTLQARINSEVDPNAFLGIKSHAGFFTVQKNSVFSSYLYFWYFPAADLNSPWIIWLNGGPGYSSLVGLFDEIGPIQVKDGTVKWRETNWASQYSLLFIDSPVGAGFSFTTSDAGYTDNEDDVGSQLYYAVLQFLKVFPEHQNAPLFIAGESYAGKYIPALAIQIHRHKHENRINLQGLAIGNGLIDPLHMMHYSDLCKTLGILDDESLKKVKGLENSVVANIVKGDYLEAAQKFNLTIEFIKHASGLSIYNFLTESSSKHEFEAYINKPEIRKLIHVGTAQYDLNNQVVYNKMQPDMMKTTKNWLEELLEHYNVLCFSGQLDLILSYYASKHFYDVLSWSRSQEYKNAKRELVYVKDGLSPAFYRKSGGNFHDVLIRGAGHMVPVDKPKVAKYMIDQFIAYTLSRTTQQLQNYTSQSYDTDIVRHGEVN